MMSDEATTPEQTTPATEPVAPPAPTAEAEPEATPTPPTEALTEVQSPPTDHAATHAAEMIPGATPVHTPAVSTPEGEEPPTPAPKKPKKPKPAAAEVAGSDAAAILLGSTPEAVPEEATESEESEAAEAPTDADAPAGEPVAAEPVPENKKRWYAVKIQSGREESIKAAIERKVKIEGLEPFFGQIVIPVEELIVKKKVKVKNKKTGETTTQEKNVTKYSKKFPGYLFTEVEFNNDILYVFRETSGVGDFVGVNTKKTQGAVERSAPAPMTDDEVKSMLTGAPSGKKSGKGAKTIVKLDVEKGDKVRIRDGAFVGSEGEVKSITEPKDPTENPKVTVVVTFWGRPVEVEVDFWQVDKI